MSKLTAQDKFLDLSDYGRTLGTLFANQLKSTRFTPIDVTLLFGAVGLLAAYSIIEKQYYLAALLLIVKSIIDAADGELARLKSTPSYSGRYLDSVFDIILNFIFFCSICYISTSSLTLTLVSFACLQLQGTLYNYYYVILRHKSENGDSTSKVFEYKIPRALPGEKQRTVNVLFVIYITVYGVFDRIIHFLDSNAYKAKKLPNYFMTFVSIYGLGFQLLIMSVMLTLKLEDYIIPFFVFYSLFIFVMIAIRKIAFSFKV